MRVKSGVLHVGNERFEAGAILPDHLVELYGADWEKQGVVISDKPKRSPPKPEPEPEPMSADER